LDAAFFRRRLARSLWWRDLARKRQQPFTLATLVEGPPFGPRGLSQEAMAYTLPFEPLGSAASDVSDGGKPRPVKHEHRGNTDAAADKTPLGVTAEDCGQQSEDRHALGQRPGQDIPGEITLVRPAIGFNLPSYLLRAEKQKPIKRSTHQYSTTNGQKGGRRQWWRSDLSFDPLLRDKVTHQGEKALARTQGNKKNRSHAL